MIQPNSQHINLLDTIDLILDFNGKNKDKLFKQDEFYDWVIQPNSQRINLLDTIDLILDFNETIQLDLV